MYFDSILARQTAKILRFILSNTCKLQSIRESTDGEFDSRIMLAVFVNACFTYYTPLFPEKGP